MEADHVHNHSEPWNKGRPVGQKAPTQAKGHLGNSSPSPTVETTQGPCIV